MADQTSNITDPLSTVFPLKTEITIELSKLPSYIEKLRKLFDFYKQLQGQSGREFEAYTLDFELGGLAMFLPVLQGILTTSHQTTPLLIKPYGDEEPKLIISDYEFLTMKIMPEISGVLEKRKFSDGSERNVLIYNKLDYVYLENKTFSRSLASFSSLDTANLGISPSTLSLMFNIKRIVDEQINSPIPAELLLCQGQNTTLSKLDGTISLFGFDINVLTSKILAKDFANAYIHPEVKEIASPKPPTPKGCTPEVRNRISILNSAINLYEMKKAFLGGAFHDESETKDYLKNKKEYLELTKLCPDNAIQIDLFGSLKDIDKLGKLFTDFLEKFNLACIVDEAIKCVMPQIPCEQILSDLTFDNFEERLKIAFPHQKNIITAISLNVNKAIEDENKKREEAGEQPLDPKGQTDLVLGTINSVIDLEVLCKIDIKAIIELIKALFNLKLPNFNMFDWQFQMKLDFQLAIIEAILQALLAMISQILDELIGCDAFDGLIAGLINSNVDAPSGLYGDLAAMFGGDFDMSNTTGILKDNFDQFLNETKDDLGKLIVLETKLSNGTFGSISTTSNFGFGTTPDNILVGDLATQTDSFGGLVRTSTYTTASLGMDGFETSPTEVVAELDVTKLATTEGQASLLEEIGTFRYTKSADGSEEVNRISNDSVVQLRSVPSSQIASRDISSAQQALQAQDEFRSQGVRNKNRHILNALVLLNQKDGKASMAIPQKSLADEIREYVKTCFSLLSPSEVLDLITANPSLEAKLTITGISRIRFPLLFSILKYPDRHALLFASFGKITKLDSVGPRLQILSSDPLLKQKMFDPNICLPFSGVYDFRKALMNQVLPSDLANKLIDDLVEDDRKRANNLLNSLGKGITPDILKDPTALNVNKTPTGKPIDEIDQTLDDGLSIVFDQIKLKFDNDLEGYPKATSTSYIEPEKVYKFADVPSDSSFSSFGLPPPAKPEEEGDKKPQQEYLNLVPFLGEAILSDEKGPYHIRPATKQKAGNLYIESFKRYKVNSRPTQDIDLVVTGDLILLDDKAASMVGIEPTPKTPEEVIEFEKLKKQKTPKWNFAYSEKDRKYNFSLSTFGEVRNSFLPIVQYGEKLKLSGSIIENELIKQEIRDFLFIPELSSKKDVFSKIFADSIAKAYTYDPEFSGPNRETYNDSVVKEAERIYNDLLESIFSETDYTEKVPLLQEVTSSSKDKKNVLVSLIDFSPLETEQQKACGIDTHLLQTKAVIKRIKDEFNNSIPKDVINTNSKINTRYGSDSPSQLSEKVMTGLAEVFIRTSVIHNIFRGLFVFDRLKYTFGAFDITDTIFAFFEKRVKADIKNAGLEKDFEVEIEKIYDLYKKDEKKLIPSDDSGENKFRSIIKYHILSVLELIKKMLNADEKPVSTIAKTSYTGSLQIMYPLIQITPGEPPPPPVILEFPDTGSLKLNQSGAFNSSKESEEKRLFLLNQLEYDDPYSCFLYLKDYDAKIFGLGGYYNTNMMDKKEKSKPKTFPYLLNPKDEEREFVKIVVEKYIRINFKDFYEENFGIRLPYDAAILESEYNSWYNGSGGQLNGVVSINNFEKIAQTIIDEAVRGNYYANNDIHLYSKRGEREQRNSFLTEPPKFGMRVSLVIGQKIENTELRIVSSLAAPSETTIELNKTTFNSIGNRFAKDKVGSLITYKLTKIQSEEDSYKIRPDSRKLVIPLVTKEIEMPDYMYDFSKQTVTDDFYSDGYVQEAYDVASFELKSMILKDPIFDLIANYCFPIGLSNTMALFNSMSGMVNESVLKLFDSTKNVIKKNYISNKTSSTFKDKPKPNLYQKQKKSEQGGPPPMEFLKAATTIPIGLLKGMATAVDPNIFLADKIVLAGKMGFVMPKYRRVSAGEELPIKGTDQKTTIETEGVCYGGSFEYVDGVLMVKEQPSEGGLPLLDYTPVCEVEDGKMKKIDGKYSVKQGPGFGGVPMKKEGSDYSPSNSDIDENNVEAFDLGISVPILPGESINIPYSLASLALAPFPVFGPASLTAYNIAMPFGPLFLALEPLIYETPQFKAAVPKKPGSTADTSGNLKCDDNDK